MRQDKKIPNSIVKTGSKIYSGPNAFSRAPVIALYLDTQSNGSLFSDAIPLNRLRHMLVRFGPDWLDDLRIPEATSPGLEAASMIAHWTKQLLNCTRGLVRSAGAVALPDKRITIWVGYHNEQITRAALQLAIDIAHRTRNSDALAENEIKAIHQRLTDIKSSCRRDHPNYIARIMMLAAEEKDLPFESNPALERMMRFGWGQNARTFLEAMPMEESYFGFQIAYNKAFTARNIRNLGYPAPEHRIATSLQDATTQASELGWPLAVKPVNEGQGRGITTNVNSQDTLANAFAFAQMGGNKPVLLERMIEGDDHRLLVMEGRLVAAARRDPPHVTGDGQRNLRQLIEIENKRRLNDPISRRYIKQLKPTPQLLTCIASQNLTLDSIPAADQIVKLLGNANVSTGGLATELLHRVHPAIREMVENVALNLNLKAVGLDYITRDISKPWWEIGGAIIEINTTPGIDGHIVSGISEEEIGRLALGTEPARIPLVIIVARQDQQTSLVARLRKHVLAHSLDKIAIMDHAQTTLGSIQMASNGAHMPTRVSSLLSNRAVSAAMICTSPQEIIRYGFPLDHAPLVILEADSATDNYVSALSADCAGTLSICDRNENWGSPQQIEAIMQVLTATQTNNPRRDPRHPDRLLAAMDPELTRA